MSEKKCNVCGGVLLHDNTSGFGKHFLWSDCVKQLQSQLTLAQEENKRYKDALVEIENLSITRLDSDKKWGIASAAAREALNPDDYDSLVPDEYKQALNGGNND